MTSPSKHWYKSQLYDEEKMATKKTVAKEAPKTTRIYVGYDEEYGSWEVNTSKAALIDNGPIAFYFSVKVPKLGYKKREPAYIGEFEVELLEEAA